MTSVDLSADGAARQTRSAPATSVPWGATLRFLRARRLPAASACLTAIGIALVGADVAGPVVWLAAVAVALLLAPELIAAPSQARDQVRSLKRLLVVSGGGLLGASAFAWLTPPQLRWSAGTVLAAAGALVGVAALAGLTRGPRTVLLVGGRLGVEQLVAQWTARPGIDVLGVCLPEFVDESAQEIGSTPILGSLDDVVDVAVGLEVDEVVVAAGPLLNAYDVRRLSWHLERSSIELSVAAELDGVAPRRVVARALGRRVVLSVRPGRRAPLAGLAKGVLDRVVAAILLLVLSPALLALGLLVRRDSPGPALFRQTRVGLDGKLFKVYKFRTMVADAEARLVEVAPANEAAGPLFKIACDPRATRIGRLLRSTSLDELPQLFNVLKGDMSLIGPRPGLPVEVLTYDDWVRRRLCAKPGMTGAWQVGGRSNLSWSESVRLDLDYVDNATLRDDLKIAAKTVRVVISRDGAV